MDHDLLTHKPFEFDFNVVGVLSLEISQPIDAFMADTNSIEVVFTSGDVNLFSRRS